jgi:hypothetical protein
VDLKVGRLVDLVVQRVGQSEDRLEGLMEDRLEDQKVGQKADRLVVPKVDHLVDQKVDHLVAQKGFWFQEGFRLILLRGIGRFRFLLIHSHLLIPHLVFRPEVQEVRVLPTQGV